MSLGMVVDTMKEGTMRRKKEYYSIKEAADYLGKSVSWIYQLINSSRLANVKVGNFNLVPAHALREYKRNQKKGVTSATR